MNRYPVKIISSLVLFFTMCFSLSILAQEYSSGHTALDLWDEEAQGNLPQWITIWLGFMSVVFISGIIFVKNHIEARWLVGGFVAGILFSKLVIPEFGLVPLSGLTSLVHVVFWTPALVVLVKHRPFTKGLSTYNVWAGLATGCILFSFVFDIKDAFIYLNHML